jgi:hypothetical protein
MTPSRQGVPAERQPGDYSSEVPDGRGGSLIAANIRPSGSQRSTRRGADVVPTSVMGMISKTVPFDIRRLSAGAPGT